MSNHPPPHTSRAHFLTLAGSSGGGGTTEAADQGSSGRRRRERAVQIMSGTNSMDLGKLRSNYGNVSADENKKRRMEFGLTPEQVQAMEGFFKEYPHPNEKQWQQLGKQFGLDPEKVKFWFQNRQTQIEATPEHSENTSLISAKQNLHNKGKGLQNASGKSSCPNCGFSREGSKSIEEQQLRDENSRLKAEVEKLRSHGDSVMSRKNNDNGSSLAFYTRNISHQKLRVTEIVNQAMSQLIEMAISKEPLWVKNSDTGHEVLNYDEYMKVFCTDNSYMQQNEYIVASRETGIIFIDLQRFIKCFMDVNQWREMFPSLISKAVTQDIICSGEGVNRDGAVQLMFAEIQMLTPMVANREIYFVRYCKQLTPLHWGIVDVSIDHKNMDASVQKCSKRPSGCIIEVHRASYCKVTWVEHTECQNSRAQPLYLNIVNNGLAFGAKHWISTLQQQCERLLFLNATITPTQVSTGVATVAGRKSLLTLAQRMTQSFCRTLGASSYDSWNKFTAKSGEDIRMASRKNMTDPGEPFGTILCAASSVWMPIAHQTLFNVLTDEKRRNEWDILTTGYSVKSTANLVKGKDRKNSVTVLEMTSEENRVYLLQDISRNEFESMVVYASVDTTSLKSVMSGSDSTKTVVLSSGFSILPDGIKSNHSTTEGGCLVTICYQLHISDSVTAEITNKSVDSVVGLVSCTLQKIRKCFSN